MATPAIALIFGRHKRTTLEKRLRKGKGTMPLDHLFVDPRRSGSLRWTLLVVLMFVFALVPASAYPSHPLDPLNKDELAVAVELLRASGKVGENSRLPILVLNEPAKQEVLRFSPGKPFRRQAFVVVYEGAQNRTYEAILDLTNKSVISWKEIPGVQPPFLIEELMAAGEIVRADPRWQEAMRKRGINDFENVQIDPWPGGYYGFAEEEGIRLARGVSFYRGDSKNPYARPVEGVIAYIDLGAKKVLKVIDTGVVPLSKDKGDLDRGSIGIPRMVPKPLQIVQEQGPTFRVRGNAVEWQNWYFRFAMHPREGLVLYTVRYEDHGKLRPVLYRASVSEMVVPYADQSKGWFFRNVFDMGEYGLGRNTFPLEPLVDCPENAVFFDVVFADDRGSPYSVPRAVALFERDAGILWKHVDYVTGHNESRRGRQLVLGYVATLGNYEYGFNWIFHQDGTLEMEVLLTGIMQVKGVESVVIGSTARRHGGHGHRVAENLEAVHHQHFFNFRLDLDVDGTQNRIVEVNTQAAPPGPENPYNSAFVAKETLLSTEEEAQRQIDLRSARKWKVINNGIKNSLGEAVGYMLVPGENSTPFAAPTSWVRKRGGFMNTHLWVTSYEPGEMNAAGDYVNRSKGGDGLPRWTSANRGLEDQDLVVWYTMGITHVPRPEEWPVMSVHRTGFKLVPNNFFSRNPGVDVPEPK